MSSTKQEGRILQRGPSRKGLRSAIPDARKVEAAFAKMDLSPGGLARIAAILRRLGPLSGAELRRIARDAETLMGHSAPATDRILRSVMKWISLDQLSIKPEMAASLPPTERAEALARVAACRQRWPPVSQIRSILRRSRTRGSGLTRLAPFSPA